MATDEPTPETRDLEISAPTAPRSRRAMLAAAAAAGGALATQALVRPAPVAGANVVLGAVNTATAATTIRNTQAVNTAKALIGLVTYSGVGGATAGVQGQSNAGGGSGVFGYAPTGNSKGVNGRSVAGRGVHGEVTGTTGLNYGVYGTTPSSAGVGVQGTNTASNGTGVFGVANTGSSARGVSGQTATGIGVYGVATGNGYGVRGNGGYNGVYGSGGSYGVIGSAGGGYGVYGSGSTGVYASGGSGGFGVQAYGGTYGVYAAGASYGVYAEGATAVYGSSGAGSGVYGVSSHVNSAAVLGTGGQYGVLGVNARTAGVRGDSGYVGVWGEGADWGFFSIATRTTGQNYGIMSETLSRTTGYAGWFKGNVRVEGSVQPNAGAISIDHPLDPERRWLSHSFVESPDMMSVYNGTVVLDGRGRATIRLPRYFQALNRDFRYQLTPIGSEAPSLHVARKVQRNAFQIAGGSPGLEVSWQITGIRQDDYANAHRIKVETRKAKAQRGTRIFVPRGSGAKQMQVGPVRPKGRQRPPAKVKPGIKPRDVRPRAPGS
jgi:hypothetical protein